MGNKNALLIGLRDNTLTTDQRAELYEMLVPAIAESATAAINSGAQAAQPGGPSSHLGGYVRVETYKCKCGHVVNFPKEERQAAQPGIDVLLKALDYLKHPVGPMGVLAATATLKSALDAAQAAQPVESFQQRVLPWLHACFGAAIASDKNERNHRFLEESLELVQACGCTHSEAHQLVDYVFGRPVGETQQEVGGVMVTLAALCLAKQVDMHACGETELARIWTKVEAIRAKQAAKPKHSPLPVAQQVAAPTDTALLDFVEAQGDGSPWVARQSGTGRGFRVHNDKDGKHLTVRGAIVGAMCAPTGINGLTDEETSRTMGLVTAGVGHKAEEWRDGYTPGGGPVSGATDPFYPAAVELVRKYGKGSTSYVQRHLRIGYNRAEYMLEAMEKAGIITPWGPGGTGRDVVPAPVVERKRADDTEGGAV